MTTLPLANVPVVVTRPRGQADDLILALRQLGAHPVELPAVAIEPFADPDLPARAARLAAAADWLVFVSPNAVTHGIPLMRTPIGPPDRAGIAAVGPGTARELARCHWPVTVAPTTGGGGSALLAHPAFTAGAGERVVIVRGDTGLDELAQALRQRGAAVDYLPVYWRRLLAPDASVISPDWQSAPVTVTIVTSGTGLGSLLQGLPPMERAIVLDSRPVVVSRRLAGIIQQVGFARAPVVAATAGDSDLIEAVRQAAAAHEETK